MKLPSLWEVFDFLKCEVRITYGPQQFMEVIRAIHCTLGFNLSAAIFFSARSLVPRWSLRLRLETYTIVDIKTAEKDCFADIAVTALLLRSISSFAPRDSVCIGPELVKA